MNIYIFVAILFAAYIGIDFLTAKMLKAKRTVLRNITVIVMGVCCVSFLTAGIVTNVKKESNEERAIYTAYNYLKDGYYDKAREKVVGIDNPHADMIVLLSECNTRNYSMAFINADNLKNSGRLDAGLMEQADRVYRLTRMMTGLDGTPLSNNKCKSELDDITNICVSLLSVSEPQKIQFLSDYRKESMIENSNYSAVSSVELSNMLAENPNNAQLLKYAAKYYNSNGNNSLSLDALKRLMKTDNSAETIAMYSDLMTDMLTSSSSSGGFSQYPNYDYGYDYDYGSVGGLGSGSIVNSFVNDKEISELLRYAQDMEQLANSYTADDPRREEYIHAANIYREQANAVVYKRAINWVTAKTPIFGDKSKVLDIQISKFYAAAGEEQKAKDIVIDLIKNEKKIPDNSPIKEPIRVLAAVYNDANSTNEEINAAVSAIANADVFLPNTKIGREYSDFLNNFLKYERVSIFISNVDAEDYPTVRAYLNVNGIQNGFEELANDFEVGDFTFADNGYEINSSKVKRILDDSGHFVSIALVIDGSGSMDGQNITNAKRAVAACIDNMNPESQELSLVMYDNEVSVLTPLTNDKNELRAGASKLRANGGTVISLGLNEGIKSLKNAKGAKAIILMTDGEDGSPETMPEAINNAIRENIAVYTISTGGGEVEYMRNIAEQTGGTFMEAVTSEELAGIYKALQNYIVNNYCFEYTVEDDVETNPRALTVGLKDYDISSSRTYAYGDMIVGKDGSYALRADGNTMQLYMAKPSVVSVNDAEIGVPIFIEANGVSDNAELYINNEKIDGVNIVSDRAIMFVLQGDYTPGNLNVTIKQPNGQSFSSQSLLAVSASTNISTSQMAQTVTLGNNSNTIYADGIEQTNSHTLKLSGTIVLNDFLLTDGEVIISSNDTLTENGAGYYVSSGYISGNTSAYVSFSVGKDNYGQIAFGGKTAKVLKDFNFSFDELGIQYDGYSSNMTLPYFGEVYGDVSFNGPELTLTTDGGNYLNQLSSSLDFAINNVPLPKTADSSNFFELFMGCSSDYYSSGNYISAQVQSLVVTIRKDYMGIKGSSTVSGTIGFFEIDDGMIAIDTDNVLSMFRIDGVARSNSETLGKFNAPLLITSKGGYPDTITLSGGGLKIDTSGLSEKFEDETKRIAFDGELDVNYLIHISDEPYYKPLQPILSDFTEKCDKFEFVIGDGDNDTSNGIKAYNSANPDKYIIFSRDGATVSANKVEELIMFGANMGGEVTGEAYVTEDGLDLSIDVDGHFDCSYYGIKHDGKTRISVYLPRTPYYDTSLGVAVNCDETLYNYNVTLTGAIVIDNGFSSYSEE